MKHPLICSFAKGTPSWPPWARGVQTPPRVQCDTVADVVILCAAPFRPRAKPGVPKSSHCPAIG
eukprot:8421242-Pyramimonas_sp.AAC.1